MRLNSDFEMALDWKCGPENPNQSRVQHAMSDTFAGATNPSI